MICPAFGQKQASLSPIQVQTAESLAESSATRYDIRQLHQKQRKRTKIRRGVAVILAILLGPFGVHRLYLGTGELVPLAYTLTLGGLMILPLIDLFCILFTKDFEAYLNNEKVIMW